MKRRDFIKKTGAAGAIFSIVPSFVLGGKHIPPSDTVYIAGFGVGGRGESVINALDRTKKVKFIALCDVDKKRAADTFKQFPKTPQYTDFREVYDTHLDDIDAIMVASPDHTHALIALPFMNAKKHAYVEKPLTHNIREARLMSQTAKANNLITQMGNQGASSEGLRRSKEWIDAGIIGKVKKVDCWTNRPVWPQGLRQIIEKQPVPKTLDWDLWLGPAPMRNYNSAYLPFKWRGFWDFGTGALGDMGCHIMETPFYALDLGYPSEAEASCTTVWVRDFVEANYQGVCPPSSVVRLKFNSNRHGEVLLNWYDGGMMPSLPPELKDNEILGSKSGGSCFYGEKGILVTDTYSANPRLLPTEMNEMFTPPPPSIPRIDEANENQHQNNWVEAILENKETSSGFDYAGPLTETVLMGNLAIRSYQYKKLREGKKESDWEPFEYPGRRTLFFDGENMRVTNFEKANEWITRTYRKGWEI